MTEPTNELLTSEDSSADAPDVNASPEPTTDKPDDRIIPEDKSAAKFHKQVRTVEDERNALQQRLSVMNQAEAERLAAGKLHDSADLWHGAVLTDLLAKDGGVDPAKVDAAVAGLLEAHPHWAPQRPPAAARASVVTSRDKITGDDDGTSWADLLSKTAGKG